MERTRTLQAELNAIGKRFPELDKLIQSAYEDKVLGRIPESVCVNLLNQYEAERREKQERHKELTGQLAASRETESSVDAWLDMMQDYAQLEELDRPTLVRLPYGDYDDNSINAVRSIGMEPIQWDVDSLDWKDYDAGTICKRVRDKLCPGSIVLFHNAALHTPEALPSVLEHMIREGYTVVPIGQLIYTENYTIDHTGRQFPAEGK